MIIIKGYPLITSLNPKNDNDPIIKDCHFLLG